MKRDRDKALRVHVRGKGRPRRDKGKAVRGKQKPARDRQRAARGQVRLTRERQKQLAAKQRERLLKQREAERLHKQRDRERAAREKDRARAARQREAERRARKKTQEQERKRLKTERDAARKAREQERKRRETERERAKVEARREREQARARQKAEREAARLAEKKAREEDRVKKQQERERQKEEARRIKEEERARREKERDEYRRAKEAEKERLRAEREAARRALEGKVARANKSAQRAAGLLGRGSTTRLYRPSAIPDQSGTTRRLEGELAQRLAALRAPTLPRELTGEEQGLASLEPSATQGVGAADPSLASGGHLAEFADIAPVDAGAAAAVLAPQGDLIEERNRSINERLGRTTEDFRRAYQEELDMSWIYHDSALEGVVYTFQELKTAIDPNIIVVPDSSLQPVCEEIRRHKAAIDLVRELAEKKRIPITVDTIKKIYLTLHPEEGDIKTVKYRRDIPQHRLYFHEYAPPDKIAYKVRQVIDWLNGPEPKKLKSPLKIAARAHYDLVRVFPFAVDSGKVARLLMNLILLRSEYPPAIVHSTERQRYYEALKGQLPIIIQMVTEAIQNGLFSVEKKLEEQETRMRSFVS